MWRQKKAIFLEQKLKCDCTSVSNVINTQTQSDSQIIQADYSVHGYEEEERGH